MISEIRNVNEVKSLQSLDAKLNEESSSQPKSLLGDSNVEVSYAVQSTDLDKIVWKMSIETAAHREKTAKTTLGSAFTVVLARLEERAGVTQANLDILNEAAEVAKGIDSLNEEVEQLNGSLSPLEKELKQYEKQVKQLNEEKSNLETQESILKSKIAEIEKTSPPNADELLAELNEQLETVQSKLQDAMQRLSTAQQGLSTVQQLLGDMKQKIAEKMQEIQKETNKMKEILDKLKDEEVLSDLAEALKMKASDVKHMLDDEEAERSDAEEDWLDKNSPIEIIQSMLDEVYGRREELV